MYSRINKILKMKDFKFKINGNLYEVSVGAIEDSMAEVIVNGQTHRVEVLSEVEAPKPKPVISPAAKPKATEPAIAKTVAEPKAAGKGKPVMSPLPGLILEMKVKEGDIVKKGDILLVMEAMKMENNILTEFDGTISSVKVSKGQAVMQNDVLVEIA